MVYVLRSFTIVDKLIEFCEYEITIVWYVLLFKTLLALVLSIKNHLNNCHWQYVQLLK